MGRVAMTSPWRLFKGKRVLVTGDTGFKGSWLSLWLCELGANVIGYALPPENGKCFFNLLRLDSLIHHVDGDIRVLSEVEKVIADHQPEIICHLAGQSLVRRSYVEPKYTFDTNTGGSANILEAARNSSALRVLVYATSDKCYRNKDWVWGYREIDELGGSDPYSASKAAAEIIFSAYCESFFKQRGDLGAASVRSGNVIGGGDWSADRIVPDCIRALEEGRPIALRNPQSSRPWLYVLDALAGYLQLAASLMRAPKRFSGSWNLGPHGDSIRTVSDLAWEIVRCWGEGGVVYDEQKDAPYEAQHLHLNCDKALSELEWKPRLNFHEAVSMTVEWYRQISEGKSALEVSRKQIRAYSERMENSK